MQQNKLFIGNLSFKLGEDDIRELFEKFRDVNEGPLTKARAKLVNRRTLALHGRALGLGLRLSWPGPGPEGLQHAYLRLYQKRDVPPPG